MCYVSIINTDEFKDPTLRIKALPCDESKLTQKPGCNTTQTIWSVESRAGFVFEERAPLRGGCCPSQHENCSCQGGL